MVVPVPCGSEDHVPALHGDALAVHGGEAALAFDDEAHGEGGVSVSAGDFIGHNELQTRIEGVRCKRGIYLRRLAWVRKPRMVMYTSSRIHQHKHSSLSLLF